MVFVSETFGHAQHILNFITLCDASIVSHKNSSNHFGRCIHLHFFAWYSLLYSTPFAFCFVVPGVQIGMQNFLKNIINGTWYTIYSMAERWYKEFSSQALRGLCGNILGMKLTKRYEMVIKKWKKVILMYCNLKCFDGNYSRSIFNTWISILLEIALWSKCYGSVDFS